MKKVILIALLFIALKAHSQGGTYTLANKPINLGWADNSGTVNIRGRLYVRVMDNGVATDSVLTVLNGAVRKIKISDLLINYAPSSGSANYIQNQYASKQSASAWIDSIQAGKFRSGTSPYYTKGNFVARELINQHAWYGFVDQSTVDYATPGTLGHASFLSLTTISGTVSSDHHNSYQASDNFTGSGTLSNFRGLYIAQGHTGSGTITNYRGVEIVDPQGSGTITNGYGIYINNITRGASLNYSIYTVGSAPARFGGSINTELDVNIANGRYVSFRNAANTAYRTCLSLDASNRMIFGQDTDISALTFGTTSEQMRLTNGGKLLIGSDTDAGTGKLQVTGDGSITGTLSVADATASTHAVNKGQLDLKANIVSVPSQLKDWYTDASNTGSSGTDLYTFNVPANTLTADGQKIAFTFGGNVANNSNSKTLTIGFGNTSFSPSASTQSGGSWHISGFLIRTSSTTYRIVFNVGNRDFWGAIASSGGVTDYTSAITFSLSATGVSTGDITATIGSLQFLPAAP